jgi:hypothetical protein
MCFLNSAALGRAGLDGNQCHLWKIYERRNGKERGRKEIDKERTKAKRIH